MKMISKRYKIIIAILTISLMLTFSGCGGEKRSLDVVLEECPEYIELVEAVDEIIGPFSMDEIDAEILKEFENASAERKAEIALEYAGDIARANFLGISDDEILGISGTLVKAYPHPLLLNNFAAMVLEHESPEEALYFFMLAAAQEPDNPIFLTNLANIYLELEEYQEARLYAEQALIEANDYGPAFQVLTTLNLHEENYILAAETMIKSAKYCFNDTSIYHFISFLEAVNQLDPNKDEYPLREEFLDELYTIAKESADGFTDASTDIPDSQLTLKKFPQITGADNLMNSEAYFEKLFHDIYEKENEIKDYYGQYSGVADQILYQTAYGYIENDSEFPVMTYIRQICAFRVLESFYRFNLKKLEVENEERISEIKERMSDEIIKKDKDYLNRIEELEKAKEEYSNQSLGALLAFELDLVQEEGQEVIRTLINIYELRVEHANAILQIMKRYANEIVNVCQDYYNEQKVLLEEYWLRCGGILKYIQNFDVYMDLCGDREEMVIEFIISPLHPVSSIGLSLGAQKELLDQAKESLEFYKELCKDTLDSGISLRPEEEKEPQPGDPDYVPDIEREAITNFPESTDMGSWGLVLEDPIFNLISISVSYDGEALTFDLSSIIGGGQASFNLTNRSYYTHTLVGSTATGNTKWFTDRAAVSSALDKAGALGRGTKKLGNLGISFSEGTQTGTYVMRDRSNQITDKGIVYIREKGGGIGKFGKTQTVTVHKSFVTGVAAKSTSTKYKFIFGSFEY
jgi:tetratricopeptide (TPR) repeat protein